MQKWLMKLVKSCSFFVSGKTACAMDGHRVTKLQCLHYKEWCVSAMNNLCGFCGDKHLMNISCLLIWLLNVSVWPFNFYLNIFLSIKYLKHQVICYPKVSIQINMPSSFSICNGQLINKKEGTDNKPGSSNLELHAPQDHRASIKTNYFCPLENIAHWTFRKQHDIQTFLSCRSVCYGFPIKPGDWLHRPDTSKLGYAKLSFSVHLILPQHKLTLKG